IGTNLERIAAESAVSDSGSSELNFFSCLQMRQRKSPHRQQHERAANEARPNRLCAIREPESLILRYRDGFGRHVLTAARGAPAGRIVNWRVAPVRRDHVPGEPAHFEDPNDAITGVELEPAMTEARRARIGVVIVVPAFAAREQAND